VFYIINFTRNSPRGYPILCQEQWYSQHFTVQIFFSGGLLWLKIISTMLTGLP